MVVLAREIRGMTQQYLASRIAMSLYALSRVERGVQAEISEQQALTIAKAVRFPIEFLQHESQPEPAPSPCCCAGRSALDELDQKRVRGTLTALRINIRQLLGVAEIIQERSLPEFAPGQFAGNAARAAQALRSVWNVPAGPIANLTALVESAGAVVIRCDFGMSAAGATSIRHAGTPPLILIDRNIPGDQCRMMLAHQLAHLVMHQTSAAQVERDADEFALELLLPAHEMRSALPFGAQVALADLVSLKAEWNVPIAVLLERAHTLELIDTAARNRLWSNARLRGYLAESHVPLHEEATTLRCMIECFLRARDLGPEDLCRVFKVGAHDVAAWLGASMPRNRSTDQQRDPTELSADPPCAAVVRPFTRPRRGVTADRV
jgi:Zn-dependent peptidase ImmA (M78 family)/transcriptional regulator with XRE-family HTH domain